MSDSVRQRAALRNVNGKAAEWVNSGSIHPFENAASDVSGSRAAEQRVRHQTPTPYKQLLWPST